MTRAIALLFSCLVTAAATAGAETDLCWPLDLGTRYLTSNFMEHRPGRFHAGIDFKTDSRGGFPARAVADGWISRIRFTPGGYGKALYLRTEDGSTYVYAHLERLADPLRELVEKAQRRRGHWDVSLQFPPDLHRVRQGDVLALTGQSGTSGPHLHFEVRDRTNRPLDPLAHGFAVLDTIAPLVLKVRAHPGGPRGRVHGTSSAHGVGDGVVPLSGNLGTVAVSGPIAFSARIVELSDLKAHRLEPWCVRVTLDDSLVFSSRNDRLAFHQNDRSALVWLETEEGRERWLQRHRDNDLDGRDGQLWGDDPVRWGPGPHIVRLAATDRAGNTTEVHWTVVVDETAVGDWIPAPVRVSFAPSIEDVTWLDPFQGEHLGEVIPLDTLAVRLGRRVPAVIRTSTLTATERGRALRAQGLEDLGWSVEVLAAAWPRGGMLELSPDWGDSLSQDAGLYVETRSGWRFQAPAVRRGDSWRADLPGQGRFALMRDVQAPYLGPGPEEGLVTPSGPGVTPEVSPPRWSVVMFRLEDLGSGIDPATIGARWNGEILIVEPDMPRQRVLVTFPDDTSPGLHSLELWSADRGSRVVERIYELDLVAE